MTNPAASERFTYAGKYVIRTEWKGGALLYDIVTRQGLLIAAGFDATSPDEETAMEGIKQRLYGTGDRAKCHEPV